MTKRLPELRELKPQCPENHLPAQTPNTHRASLWVHATRGQSWKEPRTGIGSDVPWFSAQKPRTHIKTEEHVGRAVSCGLSAIGCLKKRLGRACEASHSKTHTTLHGAPTSRPVQYWGSLCSQWRSAGTSTSATQKEMHNSVTLTRSSHTNYLPQNGCTLGLNCL